MIGVAWTVLIVFGRQWGGLVLGAFCLAVRAGFLLWSPSHLSVAQLESRAVWTLMVILFPLGLYWAAVPIAAEVRRPTSLLGISRRIRWPGLLAGHCLGAGFILALVVGVALGGDLWLLSVRSERAGADTDQSATSEIERVPARVVGYGRLETELVGADRKKVGRVGPNAVAWLRHGREPVIFTFDSPVGEARAVHLRLRPRMALANGNLVSDSVTARIRFWRVEAPSATRTPPVDLAVRRESGFRIDIPPDVLDLRPDRGGLRCSISVPFEEGRVGIVGGKAILVGGPSPYGLFYSKRLVCMSFVALVICVLTTCVVSVTSASTGVLVPLAMFGLGKIRVLLLDSLGSFAFTGGTSRDLVLAVQVRLLQGVTWLAPDLSRLETASLVREQLDPPWQELASDASSLGLYCLLVFGIAWALCFLREVR